jgi:hypothetical protein
MSQAHDDLWRTERERFQRLALAASAAGLIIFVAFGAIYYLAATWTVPRQFFLSYLVAFNFWLGIGLGCLVILMLQYLTGGTWGFALRRILESASRTTVILAAAFIPLALGIRWLYLWAQPTVVKADPDLQHLGLYLNVPFFVVRAVLYFIIWAGLGIVLCRWSAVQEEERTPRRQRWFRLLSGPGLVLYGLTITFASVDWVMSLEPHWYSTMFPVLFATSQVLTGFAFAVAVLLFLGTRPPLRAFLSPANLRDLGSLLLAFVMFWAYMSFSQFLLIWAGNLPEEIPWYLRRIRGGWMVVAIILIALHFALPFLLLISRDIKEHPTRLAAVAIGLLVMRFMDVFWWIEPAYDHELGYAFWLLDVSAVVALGGVWVWWFLRELGKHSLIPLYDPERGVTP